MLKLFQRNMVVQTALILAALLLLWMRPLITPPVMENTPHTGLLYDLLCQWLSGVPRLAVILAMLTVLAEGVWLNLLLVSVGLASQNNLLPTLLYVILMSAGATTLTPAVLVCGIAIGGLGQLLLRGTLLTIPSSKICGTTLLIGLASLFYLPATALLLSYLLIAVNYRLYGWKDWAVLLLGFAVPYLTVILVLYMADGLAPWWASLGQGFAFTGLHNSHLTTLQAIGISALTLLVVWCLLTTASQIGERPVMWQKNATTVLLFTLGGLLMLFYAPLSGESLSLFAIPFAFCGARFFAVATQPTGFRAKKRHLWIYDLLFLLTLIAALVC